MISTTEKCVLAVMEPKRWYTRNDIRVRLKDRKVIRGSATIGAALRNLCERGVVERGIVDLNLRVAAFRRDLFQS